MTNRRLSRWVGDCVRHFLGARGVGDSLGKLKRSARWCPVGYRTFLPGRFGSGLSGSAVACDRKRDDLSGWPAGNWV